MANTPNRVAVKHLIKAMPFLLLTGCGGSSGGGDNTKIVDPAAINISVVGGLVVNESAGNLSITLKQSQASDSDINYTLSTSDGTAIAGEDYQAIADSFTVTAGQTEHTINLTIIDDNNYECEERFSLAISNNDNSLSADITINKDTDPGPNLTINTTVLDWQVAEDHGALNIDVALDAAVCEDTVISVSGSGTATLGEDVKASIGTIAAGQTNTTLALMVINDQIKEDKEQISLTLQDSGDISIAPHTPLTVTILPVIASLHGGHYGNCILTEDNLAKCWGYNGGYNFANGHDRNLGESYGELYTDTKYCQYEAGELLHLQSQYIVNDDGRDRCNGGDGIKLKFGIDDNGNETLEEEEIDQSRYLCDDSSGTNAQIFVESIPAGEECLLGGASYTVLYDYNDNGTFDYDEMGEFLIASDLGDEKIQDLQLGEYFSCALTVNKQVKCWGANYDGELGLGVLDEDENEYIGDDFTELGENLSYINFGDDLLVEKLSVGEDHSCVLLNNGLIKCWGDGSLGKLGYGNEDNLGEGSNDMGNNLAYVDLGSDMNGPLKAIDISAGSNSTCAVLENGKIKCWGYNYYAQLGLEHVEVIGDEPDEMGNNLPELEFNDGKLASQVFISSHHACALFTDNSLACWGANYSGQIGIETQDKRVGDGAQGQTTHQCNYNNTLHFLEPRDLPENGAKCDEGGVEFVLYFDTNGTSALDVGDEEVDSWSYMCAEGDVTPLYKIEEIATDSEQCSLGFGGIELTYANDANGLYDNEMGDALPYIKLDNKDVVDVALGWQSTCVLYIDGDVKCWGDVDENGMENNIDYGDDVGETPLASNPISLGTGITAKAVSGRGYSHCVITNENAVKCWGYNEYGETGNPDFYEETIGDIAQENEMGDNLIPVAIF